MVPSTNRRDDDGFFVDEPSVLDGNNGNGNSNGNGNNNDDLESVSLLGENGSERTLPLPKHKRNHSPWGVVATIVVLLGLATLSLLRSSSPSSSSSSSSPLPSPMIETDGVVSGADWNDNKDVVTGGSNTKDLNNNDILLVDDYDNGNDTGNENGNENGNDSGNDNGNSHPEGSTSPPTARPTQKPTPSASHESVEEDDVLAAGGFDLSTGNDRIDRAYRLARRELAQNIATNDDDDDDDDDKDKTRYFVAGAGWDQLWTRDTAYAVELAAGLLEPEVSRHSLSTRTERVPLPVALRPFQNADDKDENETETRSATVWQQDQCGHFGGWPNLSDAIVGARGAWHVYLYTGNTTFLEWAYEVTVDSLVRAEKEALLRNDNDHDNDDDRKSQQGGPLRNALFGGCSSFMESNSGYPSKYRNNGELVGRTKALSTNLLHYNGYYLAHKMGTILMEDSLVVEALKQRARELKTTIRERLWIPDDGTYAYLEDETGELLKHTEGLGVALALLSDDFESDHRAKLLLEHTHRTDLGIPSVWPPFDHELSVGDRNDISQRYHNGRIWPFVSGYFAIAAARHGRSDIFARELASLVDLSEQKDTFAEFYEPDKTFPEERRRQLWSDTGYLGIVYQGLFGMRFTPGGIEFRPTKYKNGDLLLPLAETISLINVKYRKAVLDVFVTGYGSTVTSFRINGVPREVHRLEASTTGKQRIDIELS